MIIMILLLLLLLTEAKKGDNDCKDDFILVPRVNKDGSVTEPDRYCGSKLDDITCKYVCVCVCMCVCVCVYIIMYPFLTYIFFSLPSDLS